MHLTTYYVENGGYHRAEVHETSTGWKVKFYNPSNHIIQEKSTSELAEATTIAETWVDSVKLLNG